VSATFLNLPPPTAGEIEPPPGWPEPPGRAAYSGLAGAIVDAIAPHTEADPVAVLGQLLVAAGSAAGRGAYFEVEATRHHPNEFVVLVGDSAKARKGSSWDHVARAMGKADPGFPVRVHAGLSTGEGLIWAVRDPSGPDPGAADKRLLAVETEFASVLKATGRDMGTLSPVLRNAWDGRALQTLTRNTPARATGAHVSVIGHITAAELAALLSSVEVANGFMNRFLLLACRRVRLLPEGGAPDPLSGSGLDQELASAIKAARGRGQVRFGTDARSYWWDTYPALSVAGAGLAGSMCARAEAHVLRLALIYTLLDSAAAISYTHLEAALALWDYSARSAAWALGTSSGDPVAEQIYAALVASPPGLTRTQIRDLFARNQPAIAIDQALASLAQSGRATVTRQATGGRPADIWAACLPPG
jgi:hypothetical protein